jgi:hypothetical protein
VQRPADSFSVEFGIGWDEEQSRWWPYQRLFPFQLASAPSRPADNERRRPDVLVEFQSRGFKLMSTTPFPLDYCPMRHRKVLCQPGGARSTLFDAETGLSYGLDEVGTLVWSLCDGAHSVSEIINRLFSEYEATIDVIQLDLMELLQSLVEKKLLLIRPA